MAASLGLGDAVYAGPANAQAVSDVTRGATGVIRSRSSTMTAMGAGALGKLISKVLHPSS